MTRPELLAALKTHETAVRVLEDEAVELHARSEDVDDLTLADDLHELAERMGELQDDV